jgi:cell division protein FtsB
MNVDVGIWEKLTKIVIFLILVAVALAVGIWFVPVIQQNERMRKEILRLEDQIKLEEEKYNQLKTAIDSLRNDPKTVERLAREKLSYAKPGETVIRFQEAPTNSPVARP